MKFFGHDFRDEALLDEALTTPSCKMIDSSTRDNQRLEFLGDSVLGFLAADALYREYDSKSEGSLTERRAHMVSTAALCAAAERLDLAGHLKRNRGANAAIAKNSKTLADAVEAIIGAAWLDGGLEAAREVFAELRLEDNADAGRWSENPKGELQKISQRMLPPRRPVYTLVAKTGLAHAPVFTVSVTVAGLGEASASASTRKEAEALAAGALLMTLK